MKRNTLYFILLSMLFWPYLKAQDSSRNLLNDLLIVDYWNARLYDRLPVTYNNILQGGYINMPSARMGCDGEIGIGYSHVHPYINYNLRCQLTDRLEVTGNYRIFKGVDDPVLTPYGFGDFSDKGANLKFSLLHPEDTDYRLPGLAIGFEDFIGTQSFRSKYIVFTKVFLDCDLEISLGYGVQRIRGFFGGAIWMPFRKCGNRYLEGLSLVAEYDATPYHDSDIEKHPKGRKSKTAWNGGLKYRLWDQVDFSVSYVRGHKWTFAASTFYNFGDTEGFIPKIRDPLPYTAPVNTEPLGLTRPQEIMVQDLVYAFRDQGMDLLGAWLFYDACLDKVLRLKIYNFTFRSESEVRCRINNILAYLIPEDIDCVIVVMESEGFPIQEYHYAMEFVREFGVREMGLHELTILTPRTEVSFDEEFQETQIFRDRRNWWNFDVFPQTRTFFGSSSGKFKYDLGIGTQFDGFLFDDIYYSVELGYSIWANLQHLSAVDRLNPSRLINVRTDISKYYQQPGVTLNEAYLQKVWNIGSGWYAKLAGGYFEVEYGGLAGEILYYPVQGRWAIGVEGAIFRKRSYRGLGFTDKIRKYKCFFLTHKHFPFGSQYFLDLYFDIPECKVDIRAKAGKFLANDYGARFELSRYFDSGLRITIWYTYTNGNDHINGKVYHDKGIAFTAPLDWFYMNTSRDTWSYGMSAWLRDVGARGGTGRDLYNMINDQR